MRGLFKHRNKASGHDVNENENGNEKDELCDGSQLIEGWDRHPDDNVGEEEEEEEEEDTFQEPKQYLFLGLRRGNESLVKQLSDKVKELHVKSASAASDAPSSESSNVSSNVPSGVPTGVPDGNAGGPESSASTSVTNNVLQNVHSTPLRLDMTYTPPIFPKSEYDCEFISLALQRNFVFANALMDDVYSDGERRRQREMRQVVDAFEFYGVEQRGVVILSREEAGDYFYILRDGSVRYYDRYEKGGRVIGTANRPGQSFGELCLLYDCPPPADCVSSGLEAPASPEGHACTFWRLHRTTFRHILALRTMRRDTRVREALLSLPSLQELDGEFINRIADAMIAKNVSKGDVLFRQGDFLDRGFFLIGREGKVHLTSNKPHNNNNTNSSTSLLGPGQIFGQDALLHIDDLNQNHKTNKHKHNNNYHTRTQTAVALEHTTLLTMTQAHFHRIVGPLHEAILLSRDRRLLRSVPLLQDSDLEDFEYELLTALIENVKYVLDKEIFIEGDTVDEPALYIVRTGAVEIISEEYPALNRIVKPNAAPASSPGGNNGGAGYFGEDTLTPDENMKFGGGKGGTKYSDETVEVISDECILGRLTLSNIESVIMDLHRLGCRRKHSYKRKSATSHEEQQQNNNNVPATLDDLEFHRLFGAGTFGRVWIVSPLDTNPSSSSSSSEPKVAYALKIQSKRELLNQRQAGGAQRERAVMSKLDHPFVCKLITTFQDEACIYMLLQYLQGGELLNLIQGGEVYGGLPESAAKFFAAGILEGLTHMHRRHIIYRDLKPENVLIDNDGYAVIVDFGFSKMVTDKTYTFCGTPLYLAPEIILSQGHDRGVDYWALGCMVYEMLFGNTPFYQRGIDQKGLFKRIVRGKWNVPTQHNRVSRSSIEFLWGMLQRRPAERLGCLAGGYRDIKHHAWLSEVNFGKLVKKQIQAPWTPTIRNCLDTSNFESLDDAEDEDFLRGKAPLTPKEQIVFQDF